MNGVEPPRAQLKQLIAPYLDPAYNLARWLAGNDIDAENIALQACLRALHFAGGFPGANSRSWLLAIVRNTAYTWLRQHRPETVISVGDEKSSENGNPLGLSDHLSALHEANRDGLRAALESLPVESRETLVLRELEGLSYKEIAEITELPIGAVMSRMAHARKRLLEYLDQKRG